MTLSVTAAGVGLTAAMAVAVQVHLLGCRADMPCVSAFVPCACLCVAVLKKIPVELGAGKTRVRGRLAAHRVVCECSCLLGLLHALMGISLAHTVFAAVAVSPGAAAVSPGAAVVSAVSSAAVRCHCLR
jgi:hypothetical protein